MKVGDKATVIRVTGYATAPTMVGVVTVTSVSHTGAVIRTDDGHAWNGRTGRERGSTRDIGGLRLRAYRPGDELGAEKSARTGRVNDLADALRNARFNGAMDRLVPSDEAMAHVDALLRLVSGDVG